MRASMSIVAAAVVAVLGVSVSTQQRVITKWIRSTTTSCLAGRSRIRKPVSRLDRSPGIFVESDDRISIPSRGDIRLPCPAADGYLGFFGCFGARLTAPGKRSARLSARRGQHGQRRRTCGRSGTDCSKAPTGPTRSRRALDDPAAPRPGGGRDEARHLRVLQRRQATASDARRRVGRPPKTTRTSAGRRTSAFRRTAACWWPTVLIQRAHREARSRTARS